MTDLVRTGSDEQLFVAMDVHLQCNFPGFKEKDTKVISSVSNKS